MIMGERSYKAQFQLNVLMDKTCLRDFTDGFCLGIVCTCSGVCVQKTSIKSLKSLIS